MALTFMDKIKLKLYNAGMKGFGTSLLTRLEVGSPEWFSLAGETLKSTDLDLRQTMMFQFLHKDYLQPGPKQKKFMHLFYTLLDKGTIDEKRELVTFIKENLDLFSRDDEILIGRLTVAQRESDPRIANVAEEVLSLLKGEE